MSETPDWMQAPGPIRIGISTCLLGEKVRWDGEHAHDRYVTGTLQRYFTFVPVCPELAVGLGVPRPPIRLMSDGSGSDAQPRAVGVRDPSIDATDALRAYGTRMGRELDDLSGYLFKRASPSCGMERVKVYRPQGGAPARNGVGLYAEAFMAAQPDLPCEEEGRLGDATLRENFIERVFAYHRWRTLLRDGLTARRLVEFHTRHKLTLMAHGPSGARALGQLVARAGAAGKRGLPALGSEYGSALMAHLRKKATRKLHTNALQHLMGYLKDALDRDDRAELAMLIEAYRRGQGPLIVPITLLRHHFRRHPHPYVQGQTYLDPHPDELSLRVGI